MVLQIILCACQSNLAQVLLTVTYLGLSQRLSNCHDARAKDSFSEHGANEVLDIGSESEGDGISCGENG